MASATAQIQSDTTPTAASELYNPIKGQRFFPIPASIASRNDLTTNAKIVYGYLCSCFGRDGLIHPKLETIAREAGLSSKRQASRCIAELKAAGLISVVRTGRASYYRFLNPEPEKTINSLPQPEKGHHVHSEEAEGSTQKPPTPYIENNSPKKQTTPPRVVVLPDDDLVQKAFDAVPEKHQTPGVKRTLQAGIANYDIDDILKAVEYTTARSTTNYSAYLGKTIRERWHEDWTPPAVTAAQFQMELTKQEEIDRIEIKQKNEAIDKREALSEKWLNLPEPERKEIRRRYFESCSKFERNRGMWMNDIKLAGSVEFQMFLDIDNKNDK